MGAQEGPRWVTVNLHGHLDTLEETSVEELLPLCWFVWTSAGHCLTAN